MGCGLAKALHRVDRMWIQSFPSLHGGERVLPLQKKGVTAMKSLRAVGLVWRLGTPMQTYASVVPNLAEI